MQTRIWAAIGLLLLGGCGQSDHLTTSSAAPLVLNAAVEKCSADFIEIKSANDFPQLDNFIQRLPAKGYTSIPANPSDAWGEPVNLAFSYKFKDATLTVKYHGITYSGREGVWGSRYIRACFFVPESVNISDVTVDQTGKSAVVTFTYGPPIHTQFATDFLASGGHSPQLDIDSQAKSELWTKEHRAYMQRLDASGWRVNAIDSPFG